MSRTNLVVLVALGAALAGFAFSTTARREAGEDPGAKASTAAGPQLATLGWVEDFGDGENRLSFGVETLEVTEDGWRARISVENDTPIGYEVGDPRATLARAFGLMLFSTGELDELDERNTTGTLPAVRPAAEYEPPLPLVLGPGASWEGTISAEGSLAAGSWVRVQFGALVAVGEPPAGLQERVVWITDHAHRLSR